MMIDQKAKLDLYTRLDLLRTAVYGKSVKILEDTFLLKSPKDAHRFGNAYAIRHQNRKDLILIDAVREEHKMELSRLRESGYNIKAILLTHAGLIDQAYTELSEIAREFETQIFIHPLDSKQTQTIDITGFHDVYIDFDLSIFHMPGHTSGSVVIYSGVSGALFTGDSAVGSPYEMDDYKFSRPVITNKDNDLALRESWRSISVDFIHMLPLHGKPEFDLSAEQRNEIMNQLITLTPTKTL
jgi:glyoxylase-like metal-dependent hydrolase (beta-lactamase superfamily II)